jgi:hypothetical protein
MRADLSTLTFDLAGHVALDVLPDTERGDVARRVNRVATLDGGAVVNDFGHSYADRTITLRWRPVDEIQVRAVERLVLLYGRLRLANADGVFLVVPERMVRGNDAHELTLLVLERLDV